MVKTFPILVIVIISVCGQNAIPRDPRYPAHWWTPVSEVGKPDWEILPQTAGPGEVILSKRNELGLLSNFAATPFSYHGKRYASLEGFWQMMLYPEGPNDPRAKFPGISWKHTRAEVAQMTSFEAKTAGTLAEENMKQMGINWVTFEGKRFAYRSRTPSLHYKLIVEASWAKLRQNPEVKKVLQSTGDLVLKPDHYEEQNAPPEWHYYEIWMQIRKSLIGNRESLIVNRESHQTVATIHDLRFTIHDLRFTIHDLRFTIYDSPFTIYDSPFTIYDSRFTIGERSTWQTRRRYLNKFTVIVSGK